MRLPSAYQEVEYIQSSGTQYIDTLHNHSTNTKFEIKFAFQTMTTEWNALCGARTNYISNDDMDFFVRYYNNAYNMRYGCGGIMNDTWVSVSLDTPYIATLTKDVATLGGTTTSLSTNLTLCSYNDWVFGVCNSGTQVDNLVKAKVYYFKIWDNDVLARDFIPCYRKSDNEIGMYDLVNDTFYTNSGTGIFSKGDDVVPEYKLHGAIQTFHQKKKWKPNENTIAYYPLTSASTVNDLSGNNHTLTNSGITFGTYNGVDCAHNAGSNYMTGSTGTKISDDSYTLNVWAYKDGGVREIYLMMFGTGTNYSATIMQRGSSGIINYACWYDDISTTSAYPMGARTNIVFTYDKNTRAKHIYVNGVNVSSGTGSSSYNLGNSDFYLFSWAGGTNDFFYGNISNFIIEDKVRTAQEVTDYFNQTKKNYGYIPNSNTVVYYPLNSATTVNDLSSNNYTLTQSSNVSFQTYQGVDCAKFTSNGSSSGDCGLYRTTDTIITTSTTDLTFSVWLYKGAETMYYNPRIIGKYSSYGAIFTYANRERISVGDDTTHGIIPDNDKWFLFTCVYKVSDGTWTYYKDGAYVDTQTNTSWQGNTNLGIVLGTRDNLGTGYGDKWSGGMSDVIIENRAWTRKEVTDYYNQTKQKYYIEKVECDFTQSDCGFGDYYWRNNTSHTPGRDSGGLYIQSSNDSGTATWAIPSSIYSIGSLQKVEIELYSAGVGNGGGLSVYNVDPGMTRAWGNRSASTGAIESTWTGSTVSTSVPTPAGGYTLTIDIANGIAYTSTSSNQQTLSQTAIDSILNKWASGELYLCVMKGNASNTAYLRKATFYIK